MGIMLGFGAAEVDTAREIIQACFREDAKAVQRRYQDEADRYKLATKFPERYTYFFVTESSPYEGKTIREFTMHHINRKHPMSPDGWALWVTKWVSVQDVTEGLTEETIYREG